MNANQLGKLCLFAFTFLCLNLSLSAQVAEICGNCIDDDNDGLVDCYDSDCSGSSACADFFFGDPTPGCQYVPPVYPVLDIQQAWQSDSTVDTRITPLVADIDNDGSPEVIVTDQASATDNMYIINGQTGATEVTIPNVPVHVFHDAPAVADCDGDGFGEIVVVTNVREMRMYEHTGALKWANTLQFVGYNDSLGVTGLGTSWSPNFADFNNDCVPEIYTGNQIWSSVTGLKIAEAGVSANYGRHELSQAVANQAAWSAAADVLPDNFCSDCSGLEMIVGNQVYSVNIGAGTMTLRSTANDSALLDGYTSVADWDLDGQLDVLVNMRNASSLAEVYVWNPRTGNQIGSSFILNNSATSIASGKSNIETGHLNVADYDDDGVPEIGVAGHDQYIVIDNQGAAHNLVELWSRLTNDGSTRTTGSAFDFEGDGATEVVYQDEDSVFVFDGATGAIKASKPCLNATRYNYPTVADVNGNGQANIICVCGDGQLARGKVTLWESSLNNWIRARKVMNQHNYSIVNIDEDLGISEQQNSALVPGLNSYLSQSAILNSSGLPSFEAIDVTVTVDSVQFNACTPRVYFRVCNQGDLDLADSLYISFYQGNPATGGSLLLNSSPVVNIPVGNCGSLSQNLPYTSPMTVYVVVNDLGTQPLNAPVTEFNECDTLNNVDNIGVSDPTPPQITCPANVNISTDPGQCSAVYSYPVPLGTDNCSGSTTTRTAGLGSGATFPLGSSIESYLVTDASGNTANCSFTITVSDNENPSLTCPANISTTISPGNCNAVVSYTAPVGTDNCTGVSTSQTAGLGSGATFPVGTTTETYQSNDAHGNSSSCSFTITVNDNTLPILSGCPADTTVTPNVLDCTPPVSWTPPTYTDDCGIASVTSNFVPGDNFPVGVTQVSYTGTDNNGNSTTCQFNITVNTPVIDSIITNLGPDPACLGDTIRLEGVAGYPNYSWSTGATTQRIDVISDGQYILEVSDANNTCFAYDTLDITFVNSPKPNPLIEPQTPLLCGPDDTLMLDVRQGYFAYNWSNGVTTKTNVISTPGPYSVTVTNGFGCTGRDTVTVVRVPIPTPTITQSGNILSTASTYNSYQWYYNGNAILGATNFQYGPVTLLGTYEVEVDSGGCVAISDPYLLVSTAQAQVASLIEVHPNPSEGRVRISGPANLRGEIQLSLSDALGRTVRQFTLNNWSGSFDLDFSSEAKGVYFLRIEAEDLKEVVKLVKN